MTSMEIADNVLLVVGDDEGDADYVQNWTVNSWVWLVTLNASCNDGEWRLEMGAASGDDDGLFRCGFGRFQRVSGLGEGREEE
jgi:subtilisin-like proprotein convertase family protein